MRAEETALLKRARGYSLIELTAVLAIAGIIGSTIGLLLLRQQRFYLGGSELITTRQSVRDAIEVLSTDLRGMSVADTARLLADSAIEFFSAIGSSVVCQRLGDSEIGLSPAAGLTSFAIQPDTGDLAVFYTDSGPSSQRWQRTRIVAFSSRVAATTCPPESAFSGGSELGGSAGAAFFVSLQAPLNGEVHPGSPVRFVRRNRYSLYRASDGEWYLGYRRCNAIGPSICGTVQPVSGPYRPYSRDPTQSGLVFEYFDRAGARVATSPMSLGRVDVTARAASRQSLLLEGRRWVPSDSARVSVAIRNRLE
ncbi:MAG: Tfp pilus assembly protein FimT/FimU [Gemmatimonadaceae bacterium]